MTNLCQVGFRESRPQRGDDFASPLSAFSTISFEGIFPGPRSVSGSRREEAETNSNLSKDDFVGIILDVLKMQKNICLCRHFQVRCRDIFLMNTLPTDTFQTNAFSVGAQNKTGRTAV